MGIVNATPDSFSDGGRWTQLPQLVESVAADVAAAVLAHDRRIAAVEVTVHKPHAPVTVDLDDVAVTVRREQERA